MSLERIITDKGQVTIPLELRKKYNLLPGKKVIFIPTKDGVLMKPVMNATSLKGILGKNVNLNDIEKKVEEIRKEWRVNDE